MVSGWLSPTLLRRVLQNNETIVRTGDGPIRDFRRKVYAIIFEANTKAGRLFDILLLVAIVASIAVVVLDSVKGIREQYHATLYILEWIFTLVFSLEYLLRIWVAPKRWKYIFSFYGIIDLLSVLPTYAALIFAEHASVTVIRSFRLLRTFRIFKLGKFLAEAHSLRLALYASRAKIAVFMATVAIIIVIMGTAMYVIEGSQPDTGFTSIPQSMYWAVVTMTTVGYGDVSPVTELGKILASLMMLIGYSLIIVPTGIISAELTRNTPDRNSEKSHQCPVCGEVIHRADAKYCHACGSEL